MAEYGRGISYTPSFRQGMAAMGTAIQGRRAERRSDEENALAADAWMGKPGSLDELMALNPELGVEIAEGVAQRKATTEQRGLDKDVRFKTDLQDMMEKIALFPDFASAQAFGQSAGDRLREKYPERAEARGVTEFTEETYNEIRTITGAEVPKEPIKLGDRLIDPDTYEILVGPEQDPIGYIEPKDRIKLERDFRNDFVKQSKDFIVQNDAYGRVLASAEDASAAGDLSLIFAYMKLQDPNSVVRESEFRTAEGARGMLQEAEAGGEYVPAFIYGGIQRLTTGKRLTPVQLADFVDRAGRLYADTADLHKNREDEFKRIAQINNLNEKIIVGDTLIREIGGGKLPQVKTQADFDALPAGAVFIEDGVRYEKPGEPAKSEFL